MQKSDPVHTTEIEIVQDKTIPMIVGVSFCTGEDCPVAPRCKFVGKQVECVQEKQYMEMIVNSMLTKFTFSERLSKDLLFRIGVELMPLYRILYRLSVAEMGLNSSTNLNVRGDSIVNPIYKQMRETILAVSKVWQFIGIDSFAKGLNPPNFSDEEAAVSADFDRGDGSYYAKLQDRFKSKERPVVVRRKANAEED